MEHGIFVAVVVSLSWILAQNLLMFIHPAENRFRAMVLGYVVSLPFVLVVYHWLPLFRSADAAGSESPAMGVFHAYFLHMLLFFFYVECFYHIERSVTLRLLVELLEHGDQGVPLQGIQGRYPVEGMVQQRLQILRERGFVDLRENAWHLCFKGLVLAWAMVAIAWLYRAKGQHERI